MVLLELIGQVLTLNELAVALMFLTFIIMLFRGVPVAFLFAGFHPDYHQPTDTIEKINFDKIVKSARFAYLTSMASANRAQAYRKNGTEPVGG